MLSAIRAAEQFPAQVGFNVGPVTVTFPVAVATNDVALGVAVRVARVAQSLARVANPVARVSLNGWTQSMHCWTKVGPALAT